MNKSYYAIIPANVRYDKDLPPNAKLLYGEITALCNEKGFCWAKNNYFAEIYGVKVETISRWISKLKNKGYIDVVVDKEKGNQRNIYIGGMGPIDNKVNSYRQNSQEVLIKKSIGHDNKVNTPNPANQAGGKSTGAKKSSNITSNNTSIKNIYNFWNSQDIIKHRKLTNKMRRKINTTLKEYTEEEIKQSIKNYAEVLNSDKYWFTYRWTIDEFLSRGLERFLDGKVAKQNHLNENKKESNKGVSSWRGSDKRL